MGKSKANNSDPLERLEAMITERIEEAFASRDRKAKEDSDPWAKIEGLIDRAVGKHFEAFAKGLEEGGQEPGAGRKPRVVKGQGDEGDEGKLGILGL